MATDPSTLTIHFEPGAEPLAGTVVLDGRETAFSGWLELASLIERSRPRASGSSAEGGEGSGPAEILVVRPR